MKVLALIDCGGACQSPLTDYCVHMGRGGMNGSRGGGENMHTDFHFLEKNKPNDNFSRDSKTEG